MSLADAFLRWVGPGGFSGTTFGVWLRVLRENRFDVDWPYWARAAAITAGSLGNSLGRGIENALYGRKVRAARVHPPLFVLGVWRSGTTHLQNLLAVDRRFAVPNFFQTIYPHTFLTAEPVWSRVMDCMLPRQRFQDNVKFGAREPSEDELATLAITGRSMLLSMAFPRNAEFYRRLLTFRAATDAEIRQWGEALTWFVKKLSYKHDKPIVLKSPGHTGRVRLLLELFPDARFVTIHRHPLDVFRSTEHTVRTLAPYWTLQRLKDGYTVDDHLREYQEMCDAYFDERHRIPPGRLCEVAYDDLVAEPLHAMRRIYQSLDLPDFAAVEPDLRSYVDSLAGYRRNIHPELPADLRERVAARWRRSFVEWGYNAER